MVVLVADRLPARVRGILKLWFLEPKPNVFVSSITGKVAQEVSKLVADNLDPDSGYILITEDKTAVGGLTFMSYGFPNRCFTEQFGATLISEFPSYSVENDTDTQNIGVFPA